MSKKQSGVNYSKAVPKVSRRIRVIELLTEQLRSGSKHNDGIITDLTEKDVKRIKQEIETLKTRI